MKKKLKKAFILFLVLTMTTTMGVPVFADTNTRGISFSASLSESEIQTSDTGKTVTMTVKASKEVEFCGLGYQIAYDREVFSLESLSGDGKALTLSNADVNVDKEDGLTKVVWTTDDAEDIQAEILGVVTFKVMDGVKAGNYTFGVRELELSEDYGQIYESSGTATTELKVTDAASQEENAEYAVYFGEPSTAKAETGETFTVPLLIKGNQSLAGAELDLSCNPEVARIESVTFAESMSRTEKTVAENGSAAKLTFYGEDMTAETSPWTVATVTMKAVAEGTSTLSVKEGAVAAREGMTADYPVTVDEKAAVVEVEAPVQHVHQYASDGFCPEDNAYDPDAQSYLVTTPEQLKSIADGVNAGDTFAGKTVTLGNDLDLSVYDNWTPMGTAAEKQYLTVTSQEELDQAIENAPGGLLYDDHGNSYKKGSDKNMTYVDSYQYYVMDGGLFSGTFDGAGKEISHLNVNTDSGYAGLFGHVDGTVKNLKVSGSVISTAKNGDFVGGVVGKLDEGGTIEGVISSVNVTAENAYNVGGIAGFAGSKETAAAKPTLITGCANLGNIVGYSQVGGITGENAGTISKCYNSGKIDGKKVSSKNGTAGIAGRNGNNNTAVEAGVIEYCYNTGEIGNDQMKWVGGITGFNNALSTVRNSYNTGTIHGTGQYQPLAGQNEGSPANQTGVFDSFYLDSTRTADDAGYYGGNGSGCTAKTAEEMKADDFVLLLNSGTEEAFNKDSDTINDGYPVLKWQGGTPVVESQPQDALQDGQVSDSTTWNGVDVDVSWYLGHESDTSYTIDTAAKLAGVAALVNGLVNEDCKVYINDTQYYPASWWNDMENGYTLGNDEEERIGSQNKATAAYHFGIESFKDKTITLTKDLDMGGLQDENGSWSGPNYMPLGGQYLMTKNDETTKLSSSFCGTFDGNGHYVRNIYCDRHCSTGNYGDGQSVGFIGRMGAHDNDPEELRPTEPTVKDLGVSGYIYGNRSVGGIVGKTGKTTANSGDGSVGSIISGCVNYATVRNTDAKGCGGIAGAFWNGGRMENCYNTGEVTSSYSCPTAGLAGGNENAIVNSYNVGTITASKDSYAMAIGTNGGGAPMKVITNCWYLDGSAPGGGYYTSNNPDNSGAMTADAMKADDFVTTLGDAYNKDTDHINNDYPILRWQGGTPVVEPQPQEVDKTALNEAINAAQADKEATTVSSDGSDVSPEAQWVDPEAAKALEDAIAAAQAVVADDDATQDQVDAAAEAMKTAQENFDQAKKAGTKTEPEAVDKSKLDDAIDAAKTDRDGTTVAASASDVDKGSKWVPQSAVDALTSAIEAAQAVMDNADATQEQVDQAEKDLEDAVKAFDDAKKNGTKSSGSSSGSGGGTVPTSTQYPVSLPSSVSNGQVKADKTQAKKGETVKLTPAPEEGYEVSQISVKDKDGKEIALKDNGDGTYSFTMPGSKVSVDVSYKEKDTGTQPGPVDDHDANCPSKAFSDLDTSQWYHEAIDYVLLKNYFNGVGEGKFEPNGTMTRAMFVTVLGRADGVEAVENAHSSFGDVADGQWYTPYVDWAAKNAIVLGYDSESFGPEDPVTREQMAAILYRYAKYKGVDVTAVDAARYNSFSDTDKVSDYAEAPMIWATDKGIINGMGDGTLAPQETSTRAQVAQIIMNYDKKFA